MSATQFEIDQNLFDHDRVLAEDMRIEGVDDISYYIGLSLNSCRDEPKKRRRFHNPILIMTINIIYIIMMIFSLYFNGTNELLSYALFDIDYLIGLHYKAKATQVIASITVLFSQCIYYYNYKRGIEPSFLRLFQVMTGSIAPFSVGLVDENEVEYLTRFTKKVYKILKLNNEKVSLIFILTLPLSLYLFNTNKLEYLLLGLFQTAFSGIWALYYITILSYQIFYFYILCRYFQIKINNSNKILIQVKCRKRSINVYTTLASFDALYREINEYNVIYWSKILFIIWTTMGTMCAITLNVVIHTETVYLKILFTYFLIIFIVIFLFTILTAASVNKQANKTYKIMNSLFVSTRNNKKHTIQRLKVYNSG